MKKKSDIKKKLNRNKKTEYSTVNKRRIKREPDLWKEIRTNLKPLSTAYNKFIEKRRIAKAKEEEKRLKENEKQRLREEEATRLYEQEEKRIKKEKKLKEEEERRLKAQEKQKLEEKKLREERNERIRQEQIYKERLISAEEERIKQLKRVNELREEERKIREERDLKIRSEDTREQKIEDEEKQIINEEEQRLQKEEKRLKEKEQLLKEKERILKEKEQIIKNKETTTHKEIRRADNEKKGERLKGTVKWYNDSRGYGFIKREDNEKDVFIHSSAVQDSGLQYLEKGEQLTFEVDYSDKGPSAINLEKAVSEVSRSHLKVVK